MAADLPRHPPLPRHALRTPPVSGARSGWVDAARGVGIVLVVFGHVWRGVEAAGLVGNPRMFHLVDSFIYSFHMPLFFFLSGMFFVRTASSKPAGEFLKDRVLRLLWPLFLWTWIYFLFKGLAGSLVNVPMDWAAFPWFPLPPREQFWFLWALFLIQVVLAPLARFGPNGTGTWLGALAVALVIFALPPGPSAPWIVSAMTFGPYFALGILFARVPSAASGPGLALPALAGFLACAGAAALLSPGPFGGLALGAGATLGLVLAVRATVRASRGPLQLLGEASLAIYVAHVIFTAGTRILLSALGVEGLWVHLALGCLFGILGPLLAFLAARRAGLERLCGF